MRIPKYVIHSKYYPNGRELHRVEIGRFLWFRIWLMEWEPGMIHGEGMMRVARYYSLASARKAASAHWEAYLDRLPALRIEERPFDPELESDPAPQMTHSDSPTGRPIETL